MVVVLNKCKKCGNIMEVRSHTRITDKILLKPYYFSEWYYCASCSFVQHFEDKKIINNHGTSKHKQI